jgi:hypothetical protein
MFVSGQQAGSTLQASAKAHALPTETGLCGQTGPLSRAIMSPPVPPALRPMPGLELDPGGIQPPGGRPPQQGGQLSHLNQPIPTSHIDHYFQAFPPGHPPQPPDPCHHIAGGPLLLVQRNRAVQQHLEKMWAAIELASLPMKVGRR